MKAVILAGGLGSRLSEETYLKPKPMVEIGGKPILWHIMKIYSSWGINDFIICCGFKGYLIKEYFFNYCLHTSDVTLDLQSKGMEVHSSECEPWRVTLVDTGERSLTGGRLKRVAQFLDDTFLMTYGDGVADIDIPALIAFHKKNKTLATVTAVQPPGRFGALTIDGTKAKSFAEKADINGGWVNAGFFVIEKEALELIDDDQTSWEVGPLAKIAADGNLSVYKHHGYWQSMDTLRDTKTLNELWETKEAPWKLWDSSEQGSKKNNEVLFPLQSAPCRIFL
jgi:glucose-1-phosphate cytidylyltransferase